MANLRIDQLGTLTGAGLAAGDRLIVQDVSDTTTTAPGGKVKSITEAEFATLFQAASATLASLAALTTAADRLAYFTGPAGATALASLTAYARTLLAAANAAAARTVLGLGTAAVVDTTAFDAAGAAAAAQAASQPLDGDLTAIAALSTTGFARRTGTNTWAMSSINLAADVTGLLPVTGLAAGSGTLGFLGTDTTGAANAWNTLAAGSNVTLTRAGSVITIAATGGGGGGAVGPDGSVQLSDGAGNATYSTALFFNGGPGVTPTLTIGSASDGSEIKLVAVGGSTLRLSAPSNPTGSYKLTLPDQDGGSGDALVTNGSGNLSFASIAFGDASFTYNKSTHAAALTGTLAITGSEAITCSDSVTTALTLKNAASQSADVFRHYDSNGTTLLAGLTSDGNWQVKTTIYFGGTGSFISSSGGGLGLQDVTGGAIGLELYNNDTYVHKNLILDSRVGGGYIQPGSLADSAAASNSVYYSTDAAKLVYKDSGGTVHALY